MWKLATTLTLMIFLLLGFPVLPKAEPLNRIHIEDNDKSITLRVQDAPLRKVLQAIEGKTGIQFYASPSVLSDRITINLNASDWQTAMKKLLEPYGRMELWSSSLYLTEIHILSRAGGAADYGKPPTVIELTEADRRSSAMLNRRQLLKLARGTLNTPLTPKLLDDPEIKEYLKQYGMHSPEDLQDTVKARTLRVKARKLLLERDKAKRN